MCNIDKTRDRYLRKRYGITQAEYEALAAHNGGMCWICGRGYKTRSLHVDHDHRLHGREATRGILCWNCNAGLKRFSDSPMLLRAAADYLESRRAQEILDAEQ